MSNTNVGMVGFKGNPALGINRAPVPALRGIGGVCDMEENWGRLGPGLTAEAIRQTIHVLPARQYEIRLIHHAKDGGPVIKRHFTRSQLLKSVKFLRLKNREGYHVFFRPDALHFVFVDDVCEDDIDAMMADGIRPVLVYETSKGLHHSWFQIANRPEQVTEYEAREAQRILAERYSGDEGATGRKQLGRLPGFRNVKPMYEDANGGHPLVIIKRSCFAPISSKLLDEAKARLASASPLPSKGRVLLEQTDLDTPIEIYENGRHIVTMSALYEIGDLEMAYDRVLGEMKERGYKPPLNNAETGIDRSRQDLAVAGYLHRRCISDGTIVEILMYGSEKAAERGFDYALKTVNAANRKAG